MKENRKQTFLLVVGIICLPLTLYKYYTVGHSDVKYLVGVVVSIWLIYDYYIYKMNKPHILETLKGNFRKGDFE
ncbi:hypothetical protein Oweho_2728 [Owenweeksia hongkongensis DSM 17368]|uniref:Uncharacterized protein n=1 Tax=Owenweeksia hongkongensis (strain DSM 17368 / CIP 108786 / JCM 12287 / NRRL B-23963 / UST20020801) TaxID=926562 RepID=G8QZN8_OWEHD|nr:hypothetical protein Oweho_2728 [Owenweeksia hongkongensis DSM 17368]